MWVDRQKTNSQFTIKSNAKLNDTKGAIVAVLDFNLNKKNRIPTLFASTFART